MTPSLHVVAIGNFMVEVRKIVKLYMYICGGCGEAIPLVGKTGRHETSVEPDKSDV